MNLVPTTVPDGVSLLLVDDHLIFLDGLSLALAPLARDLRVDSAASVQAAEQCLASHDYDLVLLDLKLPDESGLSVLQRWQREGRSTPVAILSASESAQDAHAARQAGALGFISKSASGAQLREAVGRLLLGENLPLSATEPVTTLTPRQQEILLLLAEGLPNKAIGRRLKLSEETVKTHLRSLFQTLPVHTRTACVTVARQRGWL